MVVNNTHQRSKTMFILQDNKRNKNQFHHNKKNYINKDIIQELNILDMSYNNNLSSYLNYLFREIVVEDTSEYKYLIF